MLGTHRLMAFIATADRTGARVFYGDVLGLPILEESEWALVFDANGTTLRVQVVSEINPAPHTALGWQVPDIDSAVARLRAKGIAFLRYPSMTQNEAGVWTTPDGSSVAWFKDPSGNVLSLTQAPPGVHVRAARRQGRSPTPARAGRRRSPHLASGRSGSVPKKKRG